MWKAPLYTILILFSAISGKAQELSQVSGRVVDEEGKPLPFASLRSGEITVGLSDEDGRFQLMLPPQGNKLSLTAEYMGKLPQTKTITLNDQLSEALHFLFTLSDNDLYLDNVTVMAKRNEESVSNSAYVIDRMTIENAHAYSLADLLQLLPGQRIKNPQLQEAQGITFRSTHLSGGVDAAGYARNNSFGIGLYMNGVALSNDANMQAVNPLTNGFFRSFRQTQVDRQPYGGGDTPGGGLDLRSIPVGNIERVEVVQGVASAKYGNLSSGAIIIESIAGRSPLYVNMRQAGGNSHAGINKGFLLNGRHALNINADYLFSNANPSNRLKSYNRASGGIMWTAYAGAEKQIRNNFSLNYSTTLDDYKSDPDFGDDKITYYKNNSLRISNNSDVRLKTGAFDGFQLSLGLNTGHSSSYTEEFVNPGVTPVTNHMEKGVAEGSFSPPSYIAVREIDGKPLSVHAALDFRKQLGTEKSTHRLLYGVSFNYQANLGEGRRFNPLRPGPGGSAADSERSLSYQDLRPTQRQLGFYIEDRMETLLFGKTLRAAIGARLEMQNGFSGISPRLNFRYGIWEHLSLTGGFGLMYKAPGLIHLYPGIRYQDYMLLNSYNGKENESLYLAYTHVEQADNDGLKPMRSLKKELGLRYAGNKFYSTLSFFLNTDREGFGIASRPGFLQLPLYEITGRPENEKPVYDRTGESRMVIYERKKVVNAVYSRNKGIEWVLGLSKVRSIQTSFDLNLTYYNSYFFNDHPHFSTGSREPQPGDTLLYGIYPSSKTSEGRMQALLTINHHLSRLGLLVNLRAESFLLNFRRTLQNTNRAIAYINDRHEIIAIAPGELNDPKYDLLDLSDWGGNYLRNPDFVYFNFHLSLSKNLGKNTRLSFFANNFLNIRPESIDSFGAGHERLNQEPYFGMELFFKF